MWKLNKKVLSVLLVIAALPLMASYAGLANPLPNGVFLQGITSSGAIQRLLGIAAGTGSTVVDSPTGSSILFQRNAATQWSFDSSGNFLQGAGADEVLTTSGTAVRADTTDGADNKGFYFTGGGAVNTSGTRGALLETQGNEGGSVGRFLLQTGNAAGTGTVRTMGSGDLIFGTNNLTRWTLGGAAGTLTQDATNGGDVVVGVSATAFRMDTSDATDNKSWYLNGGGGISTSGTRGALIELSGNESNGGRIIVQAGNSTGTATFGTRGSGDVILMNNGSTRWTVNSSGSIVQDATNGGAITFNQSSGNVLQGTSDASDTNAVCVSGGGTCADSRGGYAVFNGNENGAQTGSVQLVAGNVAGASIQFRGAGSGKGTINGATGNMVMTGEITSSATGALGWSVQSAANQACNTTCTSACVFGFNLTAGVPGTMLACTDATSDVCLCAGAT